MKCTGEDKQTPHGFMRAMWNRRSECCGPLVDLRIKSSSVAQMATALDVVEASHVLSQADQGDGSYIMCAAHWYDVSLVIGGAGEAYENDVWKTLRTTLFAMTSLSAGWDYREMSNRFASFYRAKTGGYRSLGAA